MHGGCSAATAQYPAGAGRLAPPAKETCGHEDGEDDDEEEEVEEDGAVEAASVGRTQPEREAEEEEK